ncbi:hypothetical protein PIB30_008800 [Stylosanthes scabra]|uniref:Uncharacterized protein n=1 Tax=Stylosanthes scabra TaxID=79078 RepID=A0ABU6X2B2_9FABA|nr:hypothetical protein [Stylosanthes scabra]
MYSPCFVSQPVRSGFDQNSTAWLSAVAGLAARPTAARHRVAIGGKGNGGRFRRIQLEYPPIALQSQVAVNGRLVGGGVET